MSQCSATLSNGNRCKRHANEASYFCPMHQASPDPPEQIHWEPDPRCPILGLPAESVDNMLQYMRYGSYPTKDPAVQERRAFCQRLSDVELIHAWLRQNKYADCGNEECILCNAHTAIRYVP